MCNKVDRFQGRIQDFKLGGALKKIAPSGGRRENFWGISCEKSRFYHFPGAPPPLDPPLDFIWLVLGLQNCSRKIMQFYE
jgi:hypothetical protein